MLDDAAQGLPGIGLNEKQEDDLKSIVRACEGVLDDTNAVLEKFETLGLKSSSLKGRTEKVWKKITWDEESIRDLRSRIVSNTTLLHLFILSLASSVLLFEVCSARNQADSL